MRKFGGKYEAQKIYDEFNTTQVKLKLNDRTDADILRWLYQQKHSAVSSMQGSIKQLIRNEIAIRQQAEQNHKR